MLKNNKLENNLQGVQVIPHHKILVHVLTINNKKAEKGKSRPKYFIKISILNSNSNIADSSYSTLLEANKDFYLLKTEVQSFKYILYNHTLD